jgi:hypothetical protein
MRPLTVAPRITGTTRCPVMLFSACGERGTRTTVRAERCMESGWAAVARQRPTFAAYTALP